MVKDNSDRNYSFSEIEQDHRFLICKREAIISLVVWFMFMFSTVGVAYSIGSRPIQDYTYIWGIPAWYFATIAVVLGFVALVFVLLIYVFKDFELTD